eukprot:IDg21756t1
MVRGSRNGPFCHVTPNDDGGMLDTSQVWKVKCFKTFFRTSLMQTGLDSRTKEIMKIIQMTGVNADRNYCEAYNDCAPGQVP